MNYSIIIITHNRNDLLRNCLKSIFEANHLSSYEIIVVINGKDHQAETTLKNEFNTIKWLSIASTTPAEARNVAIEMASYDFLCFLDDDTLIPPEYFEIATNHINPELSVLGGPDRTYPNSSLFEQAIGETLKSPLATGGTRYRHNSKIVRPLKEPSEKSFILCNLWINKNILNKLKVRFDGDFFRNEENVLLHLLEKENMLYLPSLYVFHKRKGNVLHLLKAVSKSAYFRIKSFYKYPSSFSVTYLSPLLAFILFLFFIPFHPYSLPILLLSYTILILIFSLRKSKIHLIPFIMGIHLLIHVGYTVGLLSGIFLVIPKKLFRQFSN